MTYVTNRLFGLGDVNVSLSIGEINLTTIVDRVTVVEGRSSVVYRLCRTTAIDHLMVAEIVADWKNH